MNPPKYNKYILRRTPTCADITNRLGLFVGEPIYLQLRDASCIYGKLTVIDKTGPSITVDTAATGRKIIQVADITLTYLGPAAELQRAWQQWAYGVTPLPYPTIRPTPDIVEKLPDHLTTAYFTRKTETGVTEKIPLYSTLRVRKTGESPASELGNVEMTYPTTPLDRHMAAVRRYLDGETTTLDQALGLAHETRGKPKKHTSKDKDTLCWKAFIRRELLEQKMPWSGVAIEVPGALDSSAFWEAMTLRHKSMMARALRFALKFAASLPIKDPNLLKKNSPERKQAERLLEQMENLL